jgi:hypothetical protein
VSPLPCHLHPSPLQLIFLSVMCSTALGSPAFLELPPQSLLPLSFSMAPPQIRVLEPHPWPRSTVTPLALNELVNGGLLVPASNGLYPAWMFPPASDREPNPPYG